MTLIACVYGQTVGFDFVNFDDPYYIYENPRVLKGLSPDNIRWALAAIHFSNWHPLTWMSHMLDVSLFGTHPGGHHLTSVLLHMLNSVLLLTTLWRLTGSLSKSSVVAGLFALHPLHVESVAWVSERKDVLSTLFWILAMRAYDSYATCPNIKRYLMVAMWFVMGLMTKPMVVTLPCVLFLMDIWPLDRLRSALDRRRCVMEKLPLLALSVASGVITIIAQAKGGSVQEIGDYPLLVRAANALQAYMMYLWKTIWPLNLSPYYPYPKEISLLKAGVSAIFLTGASLFALRFVKNHPYVTVGWFWYLGTLLPVIGIVQVGAQAMADRYTYVPLIGIFIVFAWGIPDVFGFSRRVLQMAVSVMMIGLAGLSWVQTGFWRNSGTLYGHALAIHPNNLFAHINLGVHYANLKLYEKAIEHFEKATTIKPDYPDAVEQLKLAHLFLGRKQLEAGAYEDARYHLARANRVNPDSADGFHLLGFALMEKGDFIDAIPFLKKAVELDPSHVDALNDLVVALAQKGNFEDALFQLRKAAAMKPNDMDIRRNLEMIERRRSGSTSP